MKTRTLLLSALCTLTLGGKLSPVTAELLCEYSFETAEFYKMEGYGGMKRSYCVRENGQEARGIINRAIDIVQPPWFETKTSRRGGRCLGAHHRASSRDIKDRTEWEWVAIPTEADYYYGWSINPTMWNTNDNDQPYIAQWFFSSVWASGALLRIVKGNKLQLRVDYAPVEKPDKSQRRISNYDLGAITAGEWTDVVFMINMNWQGGEVKVWVNEVKKLDKKCRIGKKQTSFILKTGIYRPYTSGGRGECKLLMDELRVGTSYEEVDPSGQGSTTAATILAPMSANRKQPSANSQVITRMGNRPYAEGRVFDITGRRFFAPSGTFAPGGTGVQVLQDH